MTSTRVPIPTTTNLKERIAALEQRNSTIAAPSSRSVSPAPGAAGSSTSTVQPAGAFRDKIAKFERKGGVPVPRGRFGLGAPPPSSHGPSKQGQLYGNRIPAPARVVSTGSAYSLSSSSGGQGFSRAASPTGESVVGDRRSFSMSSMGGSEFGDDMDYTPVGSPTFAFPLESPDSLVSVPYSPEGPSRPVSTVDGEPANFNRPIARGTSFQKALEIARNAEVAKVEGRESFVTSVAPEEFEGKESVMVSPIPPPTPVVSPVANSSEPVVAHELVAETPIITAAESLDDKKSEIVEAAQSTHEPLVDAAVNKVEAQVLAEPPAVEPQVQESTTPEPSPVQVDPVPTAVPAPLDIAPLDQAPASIQSSPVEEESISTPIAPTPVTPETIITHEPQPKAAFTTPKFVEVAPLNIRKVSTPPRRPSTEPSHEPIPTTLPALESLVKPEVAAPPPVIVVDEVATVVDVPPAALDVQASAPVAPAEPRVEAVTAKTEPVPRISIMLPPPEIVLDVEKKEEEARKSLMVEKPTGSKPTQPSESVDEFNSRKAPLALNPAIMENDESLVSPPLFTHASVQSLTTVLTNYYTGGLADDGHEKTFRPSTPPPLPTTTVWPLSPEATLAYDAPETPEQPVTVPPARPRVQALDPQSFLSPPATAFSVAGSSAGSSMGSMSSLGSRPMSMIETSPTHITRAMRMTPATSRGVPVYLPPNSSRPRKSDFVYFPPTPDADQTQFVAEPAEEEEGRRRRDSEPDLPGLVNRQMPTFTAVVHNKIKEVPATATLPRSKRNFAPSTPQVKRIQRTALPEPPLSPGQGELAALLQETMLLEDTLSKGELPAEHVDPAELERREKERLAEIARAEAEAKAKKEAEEEEAHRKRIAYATAQLQAKRDEPTSGKLKHTFLIPLSKAMSVHHRKESSSTSTLNGSVAQPKSAGVPVPPVPTRAETLDVVSSSQAVKSVPRPKTPEVPPVPKMPELPTKSPKSSRFASLRRLGSMSRSSAAHSARHSNSTSSELSSEDSQPVVTPPETHLEFKLNDSSVSEFGHVSNGSTSSFPSLSPKKSISSIGRATSFAEKMWSRSRTKSGASSLSGASDATIDTSPQLPTLVPSSLEIPSLSVNLAPLSELEENKIVQPPRRSTSLKRSVNLPSIPTEPVPPLPTTTQVASSAAHAQNPDMSNDSSYLQPLPSGDSNRPSSWMSVSSAGSLGSLPSPFFDKSLFDAFPSVPENMPINEHPSFPLRRDNSVPVALKSAAAANAGASSFDSALLSSAIHLASAQKAAGVPTTPATGVPPRRSGEVAR